MGKGTAALPTFLAYFALARSAISATAELLYKLAVTLSRVTDVKCHSIRIWKIYTIAVTKTKSNHNRNTNPNCVTLLNHINLNRNSTSTQQ